MSGGRSRKLVGNAVPGIVRLLDERPELRDVLDLADALDMAARWNA